MTKTVSYSPEMYENSAYSTDSGADTMYSASPNNKTSPLPNENTVLTSQQTYFADEKVKIPETTSVSN